jgi:hypothetical protein
MDKKTQKAIRGRAFRLVWKEMKNDITMKDLADSLGVPLATFYRILKAEKVNQSK